VAINGVEILPAICACLPEQLFWPRTTRFKNVGDFDPVLCSTLIAQCQLFFSKYYLIGLQQSRSFQLYSTEISIAYTFFTRSNWLPETAMPQGIPVAWHTRLFSHGSDCCLHYSYASFLVLLHRQISYIQRKRTLSCRHQAMFSVSHLYFKTGPVVRYEIHNQHTSDAVL
jgi:hypothetical protein